VSINNFNRKVWSRAMISPRGVFIVHCNGFGGKLKTKLQGVKETLIIDLLRRNEVGFIFTIQATDLPTVGKFKTNYRE
jgi:hypothetical protein